MTSCPPSKGPPGIGSDRPTLGLEALLMSFALYLLGFVLVIVGIAWGMSTAGIGPLYIGIVSVILLGLGILTGVSKTRSKDPPTT